MSSRRLQCRHHLFFHTEAVIMQARYYAIQDCHSYHASHHWPSWNVRHPTFCPVLRRQKLPCTAVKHIILGAIHQPAAAQSSRQSSLSRPRLQGLCAQSPQAPSVLRFQVRLQDNLGSCSCHAACTGVPVIKPMQVLLAIQLYSVRFWPCEHCVAAQLCWLLKWVKLAMYITLECM